MEKTPALEALFVAVWYGDLRLLPEPVKEFYTHTGTLAVLAVSGQHVWILLYVVMALVKGLGHIVHAVFPRCLWRFLYFLQVFPPGWGLVFCSLCLFLTAQGNSSTVRALALYTSFYVLRGVSGFSSPIQILSTSGALLFLWEPAWISQPGFVLSFCGTALSFIFGGKILIASGILSVALLPLLAYYFGKVSLLAPVLCVLVDLIWVTVWIPLGFLLPLFFNEPGVKILLPAMEKSVGTFFQIHNLCVAFSHRVYLTVPEPDLVELILLESWILGAAAFLISRGNEKEHSHCV